MFSDRKKPKYEKIIFQSTFVLDRQEIFMITLIDGLSLGSIYALIALGYTMVYGIAKMLNFAHGDIIMVGAYAILVAMTTTANPIVAVVASVIVCTLLGVFIEKAAYKPLRGASPLAVLITAIGVSYLLQSLAQLIFESKSKPVPGWRFGDIPFLKAYGINTAAVVTLVAGAIIMVALTVFINVTRTGRAMLAVSEDRDAAKLMGINVNRIITITFAIGSGGYRRCAALLLLPHAAAHHRRYAWYQGFYGGCYRRYRFDSGSYAWGNLAWRYRKILPEHSGACSVYDGA